MHSNEYGHFKWFIYLMFGAKVALDKATKLVGAMHAEISRTQCAWSVKSVHTKFGVHTCTPMYYSPWFKRTNLKVDKKEQNL